MADSTVSRLDDLRRFYGLLGRVAARQGGPRHLTETIGTKLPQRGVYFFFEPGEMRDDSGEGPRVVRVGTHALRPGAASTLQGRLRQHSGSRAGSGNHRGSIFRLLTGDALVRCGTLEECPSWGLKGAALEGSTRDTIKRQELAWEQAVSRRLSTMDVVWLDVPDDPGPDSLRGWIERNAISLISNEGKAALDAPSKMWLGHHSSRHHVRASGIWNQNHVDEAYDPSFLDDLARLGR